MISFVLFGAPVAWKRPFHKISGGRVIVFDTQKREKEQARWQMRSYFTSNHLISCPVDIEMTFCFKIPSATSKARKKEMLVGMSKHMTKPDVDNVAKFYLDCLTGVVLLDDSIVFSLRATKLYSEEECVRIFIRPHHPLPEIDAKLDLLDFLDDDEDQEDKDEDD